MDEKNAKKALRNVLITAIVLSIFFTEATVKAHKTKNINILLKKIPKYLKNLFIERFYHIYKIISI